MELSAQRSAASSLQSLNRSRPQASLLPPAASFNVKHVTTQLQQVLNTFVCQSVHVTAQSPGNPAHAAALAALPGASVGSHYIVFGEHEYNGVAIHAEFHRPKQPCSDVAIDGCSQAASVQPGKARRSARKSRVVAAQQVAAAPWTCQAVQPQHAEAELLEGGQPAVPAVSAVSGHNTVADLETILQERDACGVRTRQSLLPW